MRIAVDCRMIGMSGIGVYLANVVRAMSEDVMIDLFLVGEKEKIESEGIRYKALKEWNAPIFSTREMCCFPTRFVNQCDAFFTANYNVPFGIKIPIFSMIHDVVFFDIGGLTGRIGKMIRYLLMKRTMLISKCVFTVSHFSRDRIRYHLGTKTKMEIAYSGINNWLKRWKERQTTSAAQSKNYFVFVGNIKRHKGLKTLLEAFEKVRRIEKTTKLLIVGEKNKFRTTDRSILKMLEQEGGVEGVEFTGYVEDDTLYKLIRDARALIQPSLYEGFGLPPLEAMYLGTPVVLSDIDVFKEIYGDAPVRFFKVSNAEDLASKMLDVKTGERVEYENCLYDMKRSAQIITAEIQS